MKRLPDLTRRSFLRIPADAPHHEVSPAGIHVAGIVVMTRPENFARVRAALSRLSGAEIHAADPCGKLAVTLEAPTDGAIADLLTQIPDMPGVLSCTLAHHHSEETDT